MGSWTELVADTVLKPRQAARRLLALDPAPGVLVEAAVAVTALGIVLAYLALRLAGGEVDWVSQLLLGRPLVGAGFELAIIAIVGWLTWQLGRSFGGTGGLKGAMTLVVWLNGMMVLVQLAQLVALVVLPPLAGLLAVVTVVWAVWTFASFVTELHGFENQVFVLGGVVLTMIVLVLALGMGLALLGVEPREPI